MDNKGPGKCQLDSSNRRGGLGLPCPSSNQENTLHDLQNATEYHLPNPMGQQTTTPLGLGIGGGQQHGGGAAGMTTAEDQGSGSVTAPWHSKEEYQTSLLNTSSLTLSPEPDEWKLVNPNIVVPERDVATSDLLFDPSTLLESSSFPFLSANPPSEPLGSEYLTLADPMISSAWISHNNLIETESDLLSSESESSLHSLTLQSPVMGPQPSTHFTPLPVEQKVIPPFQAAVAEPLVQQETMELNEPSTSYYPSVAPFPSTPSQPEAFGVQSSSSSYLTLPEANIHPKSQDLIPVPTPGTSGDTSIITLSDATSEEDDIMLLESSSDVGGNPGKSISRCDVSGTSDTSSETLAQTKKEDKKCQMIRRKNNLASLRYRQRQSENFNESREKLTTLQTENERLMAKASGLQRLRDDMAAFTQSFYKKYLKK